LIASVKEVDARLALLEEAIVHSLSLTEIKQRTRVILNKTKEPAKDLKQRLTQTVQMAKKNKVLWSDPNRTRQLEQLLSQLEEIVTN
jgi:ParB family chromosome partitioning protein